MPSVDSLAAQMEARRLLKILLRPVGASQVSTARGVVMVRWWVGGKVKGKVVEAEVEEWVGRGDEDGWCFVVRMLGYCMLGIYV